MISDAAIANVLVNAGIAGVFVYWFIKTGFPAILKAQEKQGGVFSKSLEAVLASGDNREKLCRDDRLAMEANRMAEGIENRKTWNELTIATNNQNRILTVMASKLKVK